MELVFLLEEPSAKEMLKGVLPRFVPEDVRIRYLVFEGKQDLAKKMPRRLKAWQSQDARFVVLQDRDGADCYQLKNKLVDLCKQANKTGVLIRIACRELESWYLGDLKAVEKGMAINGLSKMQNKRKYRTPDRLGNPVQELTRIATEYQKIAGSRAIGPHMDLENNCSTSFNTFVSGVRRVIA
ncbi:MAG: DUF4276 family protein [Magnetococcales bacterium]|nr:DUF4276 family protein [Magnetococcales bacterium]